MISENDTFKDRKLDASTPALRLFDEESLDEDHVALMNKVATILLGVILKVQGGNK